MIEKEESGAMKVLGLNRVELLDLHVTRPTLEDVFIELTGRKLRE